MTAEATTSLFITYQTPVVLQPVVLKLTLQRRTWEQRPCSHLVDAFLKAARPSILKAAAFSQGRAPRVEDVVDADELVLTDAAGATITADAPVSELTKGAAVARAALRPRPSAPSTPTRTPQKKKKVSWSPDVVERSRPPAVGLVCTLKDASKRLDSYIRYHQRVGFARIYLYFDDASETADIEAARGYADVEVIVRDEALVAAWANLPGWAALKDYVQDDVQVRQMLNALHCLRRAEARDRLQWLVHVDSDELFDPGARSIHDHFRYLEASRFDWFCYHNFEAVPEVAYQTEVDPFLTVSLFKRAACLVPDAAKAVSETWRARNFGIDPFLFYANGKTSVRCGVGACPVSVHAWGRKDPLRGGTNDPRHKALALDASVACRVLHYACCSFAQLRRKYETLGAFPNSCVAGTVHHEPDTFHCKCRDAFLTGGPPALAALFERCVVLDDVREARRGIEAGVLERVRIAKF
ncbi:unnamed protein product [Pelagomonas calceolata]|uniref:Glycosyltransferase family 92 protein n=2 Tax=Pelagomonas calceolata TaxID=35677 RepID=A0A8J2SHE1_9STRA|nr:unnamed protein product [Pelagomonas calceolata]